MVYRVEKEIKTRYFLHLFYSIEDQSRILCQWIYPLPWSYKRQLMPDILDHCQLATHE